MRIEVTVVRADSPSPTTSSYGRASVHCPATTSTSTAPSSTRRSMSRIRSSLSLVCVLLLTAVSSCTTHSLRTRLTEQVKASKSRVFVLDNDLRVVLGEPLGPIDSPDSYAISSSLDARTRTELSRLGVTFCSVSQQYGVCPDIISLGAIPATLFIVGDNGWLVQVTFSDNIFMAEGRDEDGKLVLSDN